MSDKKSSGVFLIIGFIGILMVLIGLDLYTYNYTGKIISSINEILEPDDQSVGIDSEPIAPGRSVEDSPILPTNTLLPANSFSPTSTLKAIPTNTVTAVPTSTATLAPSPTDASWRPCPGIYPSRLHIGDQAYVSYQPPLPNRVRNNPNTNAQVLGRIQPGEEVDILDGPTCSNGWIWWKVSSREKSLIGWTSEGDGEDYWLIKIEN